MRIYNPRNITIIISAKRPGLFTRVFFVDMKFFSYLQAFLSARLFHAEAGIAVITFVIIMTIVENVFHDYNPANYSMQYEEAYDNKDDKSDH